MPNKAPVTATLVAERINNTAKLQRISPTKADGSPALYARPDLAPGSVFFVPPHRGTPAHVQYVCPCGCGVINQLNVEEGGWPFDGNLASPTLEGAIAHDFGCKWAGKLTAGQWITE